MSDTSVNSEIVALNENVNNSETASDDNNTSARKESIQPAATNTASYDLSKFHLERILHNNTRNKSIALLGKFPDLSDSDNALVLFEKQAFQESDVATQNSGKSNELTKPELVEEESKIQTTDGLSKPSYFCSDLKVQTEFINNIYGSYLCSPPATLNGVKATVVYPATEKHIEKYSICQKYLINETPQLYKEITLPYITSSQLSLDWVYNILEHKQETDRIIFEDSDPENGFILLPDLKWDGHNVENLYLLAITHKHNIKSLRDLNASHLPLLRNMRSRSAEAIAKHYDILPTQLRMYIHYQPSFYHLHIHINPIRNEAPGIWCEKSHMLDTVINNLELLDDYYQRATLPFVLFGGSKLLDLYNVNDGDRKVKKLKMDETIMANENT